MSSEGGNTMKSAIVKWNQRITYPERLEILEPVLASLGLVVTDFRTRGNKSKGETCFAVALGKRFENGDLEQALDSLSKNYSGDIARFNKYFRRVGGSKDSAYISPSTFQANGEKQYQIVEAFPRFLTASKRFENHFKPRCNGYLLSK